MAWFDDPLFEGEPDSWHEERGEISPHQLKNMGKPAFRLSLQSSVFVGHPLDHVEKWRAVFAVFEPILKRDAERLLMIEVAGKNPRRRKSIKAGDWDPFGFLAEKIPDDDRYFIGFDFQSGSNGEDRFDLGPTKFFMDVRASLSLTACVPVSDVESGALDVGALKAAMLDCPVYSGLAGYGMCLTDTYDWPLHGEDALLPVARKYPVLDLCKDYNRTWMSSQGDDVIGKDFWVAGINWLTMVNEPLVQAMGGQARLTEGLDSAITWDVGENGLLFQLGPRPITGEANRDDDLLPLYFELGRRLRPVSGEIPAALERHKVFGTQSDAPHDLSHAWARRFYDGAWFEEEGA
jgi:hypothetical protein